MFHARVLTLLLALVSCCSIHASARDWLTPFERSGGKQSATYEELIRYYRQLDQDFSTVDIQTAGPTDTRFPLHVVYYAADGVFDARVWREEQRLIVLVNNGIHPGEPDGIDASMLLLRDLALGRIKLSKQVVVAVVPVFNIGGMLQRNRFSRANQNGPEAYGFRGNAQNLDLNRDFIKMDARETRSLVRLFHQLDPDIFIDNHVSNGADYQHVMTLLSPNADKLGKYLGAFLRDKMEPALYQRMQQAGFDLVPYVNHWSSEPVDKTGWTQFYEPPRFASGFAALFQTIPFVAETHMLKPFDKRVYATYTLMEEMLLWSGEHVSDIKTARQQERRYVRGANDWVIDWKADTSRFSKITLKGFEGGHKASDVSGKPRLYYDQTKPFTKQVPFYNYFLPKASARIPAYYVLPQGWQKVISRLRTNGVQMQSLQRDTTMSVTVYRIAQYETGKSPYEGHYLHKQVTVTWSQEQIKLLAGDFLIPTRQRARRYLMETLEPEAPDAFYAWGFFDAILQQKEGYSDYVFEDVAARLLRENPKLRQELTEACNKDPKLAADGEAQLDFVYKRSPYYEPVHLRYPVFRIE